MDIGDKTLHTATFDVIFVTRITNIISINRMTILGNSFRFCKNSPILTFSPVFLAASDKANPPPEKLK